MSMTKNVNTFVMETINQKETVKAIPEGFRSLTPFIIVKDASKFIDFIKDAFDAKVIYVLKDESEMITHARATIGDSLIMIGEAAGEVQPASCVLYLYVEDVDTVYNKAVQANGFSIHGPQEEFYGDRSAGIRDAWNNQWWIATHVEDVNEEDVKLRLKNLNHKPTY